MRMLNIINNISDGLNHMKINNLLNIQKNINLFVLTIIGGKENTKNIIVKTGNNMSVKLHRNVKLYKRYIIKLILHKIINLFLFVIIVLLLILIIGIYLYFMKDIGTNINIEDTTNNINNIEISTNKSINILRDQFDKFIDLFRNKNFDKSLSIKCNTIDNKLDGEPLQVQYSPINFELSNNYFNICKENEEIKNELVSLKLQVSEFEKIGTDSLGIIQEFSEFWKEFKQYLNSKD